jgi:hypothetical protein
LIDNPRQCFGCVFRGSAVVHALKDVFDGHVLGLSVECLERA